MSVGLLILIIIVTLIGAAGAVGLTIWTVTAWADGDWAILRTIFSALSIAGVVCGIIGSINMCIEGPRTYQQQEYTITSADPNSDVFVLIQKYEVKTTYYYFHLENDHQIGYVKKNSVHTIYSDEIEPSVWTYKNEWEEPYKVLIVPTNTFIDIR